MLRRRWLIAQFVLLGTLGVLAFPGEGLALRAAFVLLTPTGPAPTTLTIGAGLYPIWINQDTVTHTVTFANGCSIDVAPGTTGQCTNGLGNVVGDYDYTVDGTTQASVTVVPEWRSVTLKAGRHGFRPGSKVRLHGTLAIANLSPPALQGPRMPVTVYERPPGHHLWYRLRVVMAKPTTKGSFQPHSVWQVSVRPHGRTTYVVVADSQPKAGPYWQDARSGRFGVYPRR
jgi:hypothetical protein